MTRNDTPDKLEWSIRPRSGTDSATVGQGHNIHLKFNGDPTRILKETNNIIQNFICDVKTAKIAQNTLIKNNEHGELKLCHFVTKVKALKLSCVKRLYDKTDAHWKILPKYVYNCEISTWQPITCPSEIMKINTPFIWTSMNCIWKKKQKTKTKITAQQILEQSLWLNKYITIKNKCIY